MARCNWSVYIKGLDKMGLMKDVKIKHPIATNFICQNRCRGVKVGFVFACEQQYILQIFLILVFKMDT